MLRAARGWEERRTRQPGWVGVTGGQAHPARRVRVLSLTCLAIVIIGTVVRVRGLGQQSYWIDEVFTVTQGRSSWATWWYMSQLEVHPPLYAWLMHHWIERVGESPAATRLLSAMISCLGAPVAWAMLRRVALPRYARLVMIAATATSGFALTYAQDARSYALLWVAAVGLTAATVRLQVGVVVAGKRRQASRWVWVLWSGWMALGCATHFMGLMLGSSAAVVLMVAAGSRRAVAERVPVAGAAWAVGSLPQLAWLWYGSGQPGFPQYTDWIPAPTLSSIAGLMSTVFAWGALVIAPTGFLWTSWVLVVVLVALAVGVVAVRVLAMRSLRVNRWVGPTLDDVSSAGQQKRAAACLAGVSTVCIIVTWVAAQSVHVWTLRGMIVIAPALSWAALVGLLALANKARLQQVQAGVLLAVLALSLVAVSHTLRTTNYKSDLAGALAYARQARAASPNTYIVLSSLPSAQGWVLAGNTHGSDDGTWLHSGTEVASRKDFVASVHPRLGNTIYIWYDEPEPTSSARVAAVIAAGGGAQACQQIPMTGIVMVHCALPQ